VQGGEGESQPLRLSHVQLSALLGVLQHHVTSFWPCKRRSNLDARVVRRLTGMEQFVDFERSDPAARGMLIKGLHTVHAGLLQRFQDLLSTSTATPDATWNKWVMQEREMAWRALSLTARGLHLWGGSLQSQLAGLLHVRAPGTPLMMLKAVRWPCDRVADGLVLMLLKAVPWGMTRVL
jgi:hypothetical protein